ncbi:PIG-L family deacetylase [uncultured Kriegella sp.]|uniref:PIG-L family deacetylase n=1 Tax=uncultured Kriegella sp. TaxID=1798910 RepID=UPI0030DAADFC
MKKSILFITLILTSLVLLKVTHSYLNARKAIYPYNPNVDYKYNEDNAQVLSLLLKNNQLTIPDSIDTNYSAFIKLKVSSSFWGNWFQTSVESTISDKSSIDYFEDGVDGFRFINISSILGKGPKKLNLKGTRTILEDQEVKLFLFENKDLSSAKILVVATHPDDAEIAAYGLYSKYPNTFVLNIKSGESGPFKYDEVYSDTIAHYRKKGQLRTWNSITVPLLGGIDHDNTLNLGYFSNLKKMFTESPKELPAAFTNTKDINTYRSQNFSVLRDSLTGSSNWPSLIENLSFVLNFLNPDIIVTPYPVLDAHVEHQYTTIAVMEALKKSNIKSGELFLYHNHFILNEYFPYGKAGGSISLPPNFKNNLYYKRIFSNPLSTDLQKDKLFALEAMHDLRPDTEWRFGWKSLKKGFQTTKGEISQSNNSYFRRAVRSNELFFVVPIRDIYQPNVWNKITTVAH